ncbi:transcription initiation factor TFIID subunit 11-like isoform X1 [Lycium barbarum]|uniref:transcription initiation factor TFIID subunit 11-like isoform X1 n=2 Tax=Lycium barbarum TaxID=112863 RepID=UPI00293E4C83|nr:transcription initiation factor TFIID subunit 11-like isoform X1 [Lycium barbarum]
MIHESSRKTRPEPTRNRPNSNPRTKPTSENSMKRSKDPFEAALEEQDDSPPESPVGTDENEGQDQAAGDDVNTTSREKPSTSKAASVSVGTAGPISKPKEEDEEEEDENMDVQLGKLSSSSDPDKLEKMQSILSQFTEEQMSRYESFRRSGFQKSNMKRLLSSITGSAKISIPMTIVVSGIAKMFVGELIETAKMVMAERKDTGPIRPCHIREAYRRLKLEGKIPKKTVPRLFR